MAKPSDLRDATLNKHGLPPPSRRNPRRSTSPRTAVRAARVSPTSPPTNHQPLFGKALNDRLPALSS